MCFGGMWYLGVRVVYRVVHGCRSAEVVTHPELRKVGPVKGSFATLVCGSHE
jgi:hypothetical protein